MTGTDGSILKRPDSEEPIEHDGVSHFFAATLADVDPFIGWRFSDNANLWPGWRGVAPETRFELGVFGKCTRLGRLHECIPEETAERIDNLILWPTDIELRGRLISKRRFRGDSQRNSR